MSLPPPPASASSIGSAAAEQGQAPTVRRREIVLELQTQRGWRRRPGVVRLLGAELSILVPGILRSPLTLAGGLVSLACVERGSRGTGVAGRFPILHRLSASAVVPREEGIEGWLWTARNASALPMLGEQADAVPNLALMFTRALRPEELGGFDPDGRRALAARSPLGTPSIPGVLLAVAHPAEAEAAFDLFGILGPLTDREVPPAMRRHLPGDKPANPSIPSSERARVRTSIAPPGMG